MMAAPPHRCILSIDPGIRNLACFKAEVGPSGGVTRICEWTVLDLCPPSAPDMYCGKCSRTVKAAFRHPTRENGYACVVHARQEKFGFFPPATITPAVAKKRRADALERELVAFTDDGIADDRNDDGGGGDQAIIIPQEEEEEVPSSTSTSTPMEDAIAKRTAVTKSALTAMSLVELVRFAQRHPGFADMPPPSSTTATTTTKTRLVAAMAAHMAPRTWLPCRRGAGVGGSGGSESGSKVSVVAAGMRFAAIAQSTGLFHGVDELIIENQLGFVAARMKAMQDVISCLAVFAGVPNVRAVSAATKLRGLEMDEADYSFLEEEYQDPGGGDDGDNAGGAIGETSQRARKVAALARANYRSHKSQGVAQCRAWMEANPNLTRAWTDAFERTKKKDDMADALLQLLGQLPS